MSATEFLPGKLFADTLQRLLEAFDLTEEPGEEGGVYLPLVSQLPMMQGEVGNLRVFTGAPLFRVVTCSLTVPPIELDSHKLFAFTPKHSAVPHFTLDPVWNRITPMIGEEAVATQRSLLIGEDE